MIPVCTSQHRNARWYYDASEKEYILKQGENIMIRVAGDNLPNPDALFNSRTVFLKVNSKGAEPAQETKDLWNHWQGVKDAV